MPRGRPSLRSSSSTPAAASHQPLPPVTRARRGRSSTAQDPAPAPEVTMDRAMAQPSAPEKRPRGRPSKASLLARANDPAVSVLASSSSRRQSNTPALGTESVSSVPTPTGDSTDGEYSTPDTSVFATPVAQDLLPTEKSRGARSSIEIRIPMKPKPAGERVPRNSMYRMTSTRIKNEIGDSEEDDEFVDEDDDYAPNSRDDKDAQLARRMQLEEYSAAEPPPARTASTRRRTRVSNTSTLPEPTTSIKPGKRARSTSSAPRSISKRGRIIPDSDDEMELERDYIAPKRMTVIGVQDLTSDEDVPLSRRRAGARNALSTTKPRNKASTLETPPSTKDKLSAPSLRQNIVLDSEDEAFLESMNAMTESESALSSALSGLSSADISDSDPDRPAMASIGAQRRAYRAPVNSRRVQKERNRLESNHPEIATMWVDLEKMPILKAGKASQPERISRQLKPFQLEGLAWLMAMEKTEWKGGLLGDEMGLGKTIQAVSLIMSDYPAKQPSLVLVPPVALMQWQSEIKAYTDGALKTFVYHGTNQKAKSMTIKELKAFDIIMMSYNSLESMYRKQEKGFTRKDGIHKEKSLIHAINFHRVILDEAHCIKTRTTMTAKACFALKTDYRWCLTGTPLQNRIGEFFSLIRFLNIRPFASYLCKQCPCSKLEWAMDEHNRCPECNHAGMQHVSVFNQELLNPIQRYGNLGPGREAFRKLRLMTDRIMLRRLKKDHTNAMELPVKEIYVDRQFFGEEENDFSNSIMTSGQRKFDTYVAQGVLLNNYANIFGLIMQMRQVADHPDLILKKNAEGGQNVLVCCICDEPAEDAVRSRCKHDFCRACVASYIRSADEPDCPRCHIPLSIDLEQPEIEQDEALVKKSSIINRIKMENWTSSSKIELLVHELHRLRSDNAMHKSIIFSQFTTMLQLIEWRLRRAGITTVMLDGSMTPAQRQASIEHFMNNVNVECFLVSLKAGGVALNLTEASRVFIVDPWWNPAAEWQSADRCHRIGQTRPCTITRLCIEDSVESRMVLIQEKKTSMINSTVNSDDKAMESLTPQDLQFLFRGS
ncbi:hypothetical protein S40285_02262 [Stachybotrys chlorohalonatus IBT 40285]|uniref:DNA repair protein RAD16 n=1 Tax=Stachybotrys chlorohalonatus (strain IBT 40285) TaxID=1283841 RepID=A0A084QG08_STAC4|nr:hypothetical protein S40285_02262 [Stachybotrys chlorohalonata IBT 40285]